MRNDVALAASMNGNSLAALEVHNLSAGYGSMTVLRQLNLTVQPGEIVGVLGANGMGKTTLMKTLMGLLNVQAGTVHARGQNLERIATHTRCLNGIAYVPQGRGIIAVLSVSENLRLAWQKGEESPNAAIDRVLQLFPRLQRLIDRAGGALSGGEQQLLALARALVSAPWLLLLDEPTEGIQPNIIDEIAQTLKALRDHDGLSVLVAEQNLNFILECADRVLLLEKGSITQTLSSEQLRDPAILSSLLGLGAVASQRESLASRSVSKGSKVNTPHHISPHAIALVPFKETAMPLQRPNLDQLRDIANSLHMHPTDADLAEYLALMEANFLAYDRLNQLPDFLPSVKYPRTPGRRPTVDENAMNAWYVKTDITGQVGGALTGKKIVLKDNIALAGVPMMNGASTMEGYVPEVDATVASRILDAGGTIVGKAHCEYYCLSGGSHTNSTGPVHNPWRQGYIAGGSSSGCGALVGAGEVEMAIGGDQGGSIRIPAAFSGCYGMKPTFGLVPYTGAMPIEATVDHLGPITSTVAANALLLEVIAGEDGLDPRQYAPQVHRYSEALKQGVEGMRVGVLREGFGLAGSDAAVEIKVRSAADQLAKAGARIVEISVPMHLDGTAIWTPIVLEGLQMQMMHGNGMGFNWRGMYLTSLMEKHAGWRARADELSPSLKISMFVGEWALRNHRGKFYAKAQNLSRQLRLAYDHSLNNCDLLLMPTVAMTAQPIPKSNAPISEVIARAFEMVGNTAPFNASGHPAMSIPCGLVHGLPVGMMLVAKHWGESTIYRAAAAFERRGDWRAM